jgi:hypothetical protein
MMLRPYWQSWATFFSCERQIATFAGNFPFSSGPEKILPLANLANPIAKTLRQAMRRMYSNKACPDRLLKDSPQVSGLAKVADAFADVPEEVTHHATNSLFELGAKQHDDADKQTDDEDVLHRGLTFFEIFLCLTDLHSSLPLISETYRP